MEKRAETSDDQKSQVNAFEWRNVGNGFATLLSFLTILGPLIQKMSRFETNYGARIKLRNATWLSSIRISFSTDKSFFTVAGWKWGQLQLLIDFNLDEKSDETQSTVNQCLINHDVVLAAFALAWRGKIELPSFTTTSVDKCRTCVPLFLKGLSRP